MFALRHRRVRSSGWSGFGAPLPTRQIDPDFARVLAAQVATGTAREVGAGGTPSEAIRARAALSVIGLMLARACPKDEIVQATLGQRLEVETQGDGGSILRQVRDGQDFPVTRRL